MHGNTAQAFECALYEQALRAFPQLTVRQFSKMLGKSSGYWSSLQAQGLPVSNLALTHLLDCIDSRLIIAKSRTQCDNLRGLERLIQEELRHRFSQLPGSEIVSEEEQLPQTGFPMPFVLQTY
ncbi:MAG: hypothetical protein O2981_06260 [Proteobacteria bacterium]|nr:hypothetical protein [Pseudomonadota bacterium]